MLFDTLIKLRNILFFANYLILFSSNILKTYKSIFLKYKKLYKIIIINFNVINLLMSVRDKFINVRFHQQFMSN